MTRTPCGTRVVRKGKTGIVIGNLSKRVVVQLPENKFGSWLRKSISIPANQKKPR